VSARRPATNCRRSPIYGITTVWGAVAGLDPHALTDATLME
jgi:hypothetical protein